MGRKRTPKKKDWPANLYQNEDGYFYFRNPMNGEKRGIGHVKMEAFSQARKANVAIEELRGRSSLVDWITGAKQQTLKDWLPIYEQKWMERAKPAQNTVRVATAYLKRIAEADFAWMDMDKITTAHIATYLDQIAETSGATTSKMFRQRLADIFKSAAVQGLIGAGKNPVNETYNPKLRTTRSRLTLEQFWAVHECAPLWLKNAMMLALVTAQRRSDIAAMQFSDFRDNKLYIIPIKAQGRTKLQQDGNIRLDAVGLTIADVVKQCRATGVVSSFMIHHTELVSRVKPGDAVTENGLSNVFQKAREKAGITVEAGYTQPSFHEIRSLSERLYRAQCGAEFAQQLLGHKSAAMTQVYDDLRGSGWQTILQ